MLESCSRVAPLSFDCALCTDEQQQERKCFKGKYIDRERRVEIGEKRKAEERGCAVEVMDGQESVEGVRYMVEIGSW